MPIEAVIFDMDGLMLHTEPLYRTAWQQASAEFGYLLSDAMYSRLIGRTRADAEQLLLEEFGVTFPLDSFRTACRKCEATAFATGPLEKKCGLDNLLAVLDSLRVPKAVATSSERQIAIPLLEAAGLLKRFEVIATGDEVDRGKPSPNIFSLAALRLGVGHATCLVLEDAAPGVIAAHSAGMQVFIVPDQNPLPPSVERLANGIFDSLEAVARHLEIALVDSRYRESFHTDRLMALPVSSDDLLAICLMHRDPQVMKTLGGVRDEKETNRWLGENLDHWNAHGFGLWTFRHKTDGSFVGRCGLRRVELESGNEVELAYALAAQYWGKGLATEMAKAILAIGFGRLGFDNVIALVDSANTGSRNLAERLGFQYERNTMWKSLPVMQYRLERDQWAKTQPLISNSFHEKAS